LINLLPLLAIFLSEPDCKKPVLKEAALSLLPPEAESREEEGGLIKVPNSPVPREEDAGAKEVEEEEEEEEEDDLEGEEEEEEGEKKEEKEGEGEGGEENGLACLVPKEKEGGTERGGVAKGFAREGKGPPKSLKKVSSPTPPLSDLLSWLGDEDGVLEPLKMVEIGPKSKEMGLKGANEEGEGEGEKEKEGKGDEEGEEEWKEEEEEERKEEGEGEEGKGEGEGEGKNEEPKSVARFP